MSEPRMQAIATQAQEKLKGIGSIGYLNIFASDNLMSAVNINGSLEPKTEWTNGIFQNAHYFQLFICPAKGKRYFDSADTTVTVELIGGSYKLTQKFRKYTGPLDKVLTKVKDYLTSLTF